MAPLRKNIAMVRDAFAILDHTIMKSTWNGVGIGCKLVGHVFLKTCSVVFKQ